MAPVSKRLWSPIRVLRAAIDAEPKAREMLGKLNARTDSRGRSGSTT